MRSGWAALPRRSRLAALDGAAILGGIGFTMALFVAGLAFPVATAGGGLLDAAKLGVLAASTLAGLAGWALVRRATTPRPPSRASVHARDD